MFVFLRYFTCFKMAESVTERQYIIYLFIGWVCKCGSKICQFTKFRDYFIRFKHRFKNSL